MEFQLSYFKYSKNCCESAAFSMPANLENSAVATGLEKVSFLQIPKKGNAKECSNYCTIDISHCQSNAQNSPSQASTVNFHMFKLDLEKAEDPDPVWHGKSTSDSSFPVHNTINLLVSLT